MAHKLREHANFTFFPSKNTQVKSSQNRNISTMQHAYFFFFFVILLLHRLRCITSSMWRNKKTWRTYVYSGSDGELKILRITSPADSAELTHVYKYTMHVGISIKKKKKKSIA